MYNVSPSRLISQLMDGSTNWIAASFCCFLIILGSFFMLNLILAVIMQSFTKIAFLEKQKEVEQNKQTTDSDMSLASGTNELDSARSHKTDPEQPLGEPQPEENPIM